MGHWSIDLRLNYGSDASLWRCRRGKLAGLAFCGVIRHHFAQNMKGMTKILVSYRREDSAAYAGRLADRLRDHFGADNVFVDIDTIRPGQDFVDSLERSVSSCDALVAVIGRNWLSASDASGRRRLDNPEDFVRMEIATALRRGIPVVPTLVSGAAMPAGVDLPSDLSKLARRQALEISDLRFHQDVDRLVSALSDAAPQRGEQGPPAPHQVSPRDWRSPRWAWMAIAAIVVVSFASWRFYVAGTRGGPFLPPTVVTPESHGSDAPQVTQIARTYTVALASGRDTYFRLSTPVTHAQVIIDARCGTGETCSLRTDATILDAEGGVIQDHAASVNRFDIAARRIADVVLKQPTGFQVKLLNSTDGRVDHWLTVVAAGSPDLVPFFGTVQPRTLQVGESGAGALDANAAAAYAIFLNKGEYNVTLEFSDAARETKTLRGYAALVPSSGGAETFPSQVNEFSVSSRVTGSISVASDALYYVRVQNQSAGVQYIVMLTRR